MSASVHVRNTSLDTNMLGSVYILFNADPPSTFFILYKNVYSQDKTTMKKNEKTTKYQKEKETPTANTMYQGIKHTQKAIQN